MYHVTLGGQGYLIDLRSYRWRAHAPFAPKRAQGERTYGDLVHDQVYQVSDWGGGEGFLQVDPAHPDRWRTGFGVDVFSEPGSLRLGPELVTVGTVAADEATVAQVYGGSLYVGFSNGAIYRWDGVTWTLAFQIPSGDPVRSMAVFGGKLYVGLGTDGRVAELSGTSWTFPKLTVPGSLGIRAMATFYRQTAQYLYLGSTGATNGSVYWWDGATVSAKQYDFEEPRPEVALVLGNRLYFFVADPASRRGAVYSVDDAGGGGVYRAHVAIAEGHPTCGVVWDGVIYLGIGLEGRILAWDGARLARVQQPRSTMPGHELRGMAVWDGALWVGSADGAGGVGLLRYGVGTQGPQDDSGVGWTRPVTGLAGATPRAVAIYGGQVYALTAGAGSAAVYRANGTYRAGGQLETGLFDARLPSVEKVLRSVTLNHAPLASGQSIQVQYQLEGVGAWSTLGTTSNTGATTATFGFPPPPPICKQVAFRLVLAGPAGAGSSPQVYDWTLRYALAPELKREWELSVLLEGTAELPLTRLDGTSEPLTGAELSGSLWALKGQPGLTAFVDVDGASRSVWFEELREELAELSQRKGYQTVGKLRLLEA